jgi:CheY-like chemotaxis protein
MLAVVPNDVATAPPEILVVDDETLVRDGLERRLKHYGYRVRSASTGSQAPEVANSANVSIVLMDLAFPAGSIDGIDAAVEIQKSQPLTSFIFVSGHSDEPYFQEKVQRAGVRVEGWLGKPFDTQELVRLIERGRQKLGVLACVQAIRQEGRNPAGYLQGLQGRLLAGVLEEVEAELDTTLVQTEIRPLARLEEIPDMTAIADSMKTLYGEIRDLIARRAGEPGLQEAVRPLREKLRALQQREAEVMELHFRSRLLFDPRKGAKLLARAERLLARR